MEFLSFEEFFHSKYKIALYCERIIRQPFFNNTTHSGIIYKTEHGGTSIFHFAWHHVLRLQHNSIPENKAVYVGLEQYSKEIDTRNINYNTFINSVETVFEYQKIKSTPYGLQYSNLIGIDDAGEIKLEGAIGLTCSTFILAFFKKYDEELVDVESWRQRPIEDAKWKELMLLLMKKYNMDPEHMKLIEGENVIYRFKPEEVASSPLNYPSKANFNFCIEKSDKLIKELM